MSCDPSATFAGLPREGLCYWEHGSPLGALPVVVSARGLRRIGLDPEKRAAVVDELRHARQREPVCERRLEGVAEQLDAYFSGALQTFSLPLDLTECSAFEQAILAALATVPYGETVSYGELARRASRPRAARAVGGAMGRNPVPIVLPCHRVLAAGGRIGGFTGGLSIKRFLLRLEGVL